MGSVLGAKLGLASCFPEGAPRGIVKRDLLLPRPDPPGKMEIPPSRYLYPLQGVV